MVTVSSDNLLAVDRQSNNRIQAAIAAMLSNGPEPAAQRLWLQQGTEPHNGPVAELFCLPVREWNFGFAPQVIVVLRPPGGIDAAAALLLRQSFDLSPAEAEVAPRSARRAG